MLSKRVIHFARSQRASRLPSSAIAGAALRLSSAQFHSSRLLKAETVQVPQMAESISEGTLKSWSKKVGDSVEVDEEIATIETDKIDVTVNAPKAGKITELLANEEDTVSVGQDLFRYEPGAAGESASEPPKEEKEEKGEDKPAPPPEPTPKQEKQPPREESQPAAPKQEPKKDPRPEPTQAAKKDAAKEKEKEQSKPKQQAPSEGAGAAGGRNETRVKMSRMRLRIAERLKESQNTAAFLTTFNEIDMSTLISLRTRMKEEILKTQDVKMGFMGFFARASCLALREIPAANASIEGEEIVYRDYVDMSVAVATPKGLVTPIVRSCEGMGVVDVEREIARLAVKARDGKLGLEDMNGGTFTISNGGVFGSYFGTPIINTPQAAVLGMHATKDKPVVVDGQIVVRPIMVVALTYDHRLLDGREAVTFLVKVKNYLEDPVRMIL